MLSRGTLQWYHAPRESYYVLRKSASRTMQYALSAQWLAAMLLEGPAILSEGPTMLFEGPTMS